jgi:hypothetical protein
MGFVYRKQVLLLLRGEKGSLGRDEEGEKLRKEENPNPNPNVYA